MPIFSWEPLDFLEALEVVPDEAEYGTSYQYVVSRGSVSLELTVWPYDGDVALSLYAEGTTEPLVDLNLIECAGARVVRNHQGVFIEFSAVKAFGGRYNHTDAPPYGFRLQVQPFIQLTTFSYPV